MGPDNTVVVADSSNHRVQIFDEHGQNRWDESQGDLEKYISGSGSGWEVTAMGRESLTAWQEWQSTG